MTSASPPRSRRRWIALGVVLAALLTLGVTYQFGIKRLPPTDPAAMDQLDSEMFAELQTIYETFATQPENLWDAGYRYDREPLLLVRRDSDGALTWPYVYLVNMSSVIDTSAFARISFPEDGVLSDVRVAKDVDLATLKAWSPGNFVVVDMEPRSVLAFKYAPNQFSDETSTGMRFAPFSMHEGFHVNVQTEWSQDRPDGPRRPEPPVGEERRAAFAEEFAALDATVGVDDLETLWPLAERIVAARRAQAIRYPEMGPRSGLETVEGSARYLEYRYESVTGDSRGQRGEEVTFSDVIGMDPATLGEDLFEHALWYETGAALGVLLDHLAPDWKVRIADGKTNLIDVLADAVDAHTAG